MKATCQKRVVFTTLVNDSEVAFGRRFLIRNDAIQFTYFKRSRVIRIVEADYEMNSFVFHINISTLKRVFTYLADQRRVTLLLQSKEAGLFPTRRVGRK